VSLFEALQLQAALSKEELLWYAATASKRYKKYPVKKRNGGERIICHPSRGLKAIQRWIIEYVFKNLEVHGSATAYKKGASTKKNADIHKNHAFTLRVDFEEFFPSFSSAGVHQFINKINSEKGIGLKYDEVLLIDKFVTRYGSLTIGAPTSPILTNLMMYSFDDEMSHWCIGNDMVYSRYADDVFISCSAANQLGGALVKLREVAKQFPYADLKVNEKKTKFLSKRYRRSVTGIVITPDGNLSVGREVKRKIRTLVYLYKSGSLDTKEIPGLQGMISYIGGVEPDFINSIARKYGSSVLQSLKDGHFPARV